MVLMGREARAKAKRRGDRYRLAARALVPPCSVCRLPAFFACADCLIDRDDKIALCDRAVCCLEHEQQFRCSHPRTVSGPEDPA